MATLPAPPPNSRLKIISSYQCNDGTTHQDLEVAERHNAGLDLLAAFMREGYTNDGLLKRLCLDFAKNYERFIPHCNELKVISQRAIARKKKQEAMTERN